MAKKPSLSAPKLDQHAPNVLPLDGELDLHLLPEITASLDAIIDKRPRRFVVDLSDVSYIDSAGLAALITARQRVQAYGGQFSLAGLKPTLLSIFKMSRLDEVFQILPKC